MRRTANLALLTLFSTAMSLHAQSLNTWVETRVDAAVAKSRDQSTQQIDPPAALAPAANLADLTAATDFVSLAAGFAGIGKDFDEGTQSVTVNAYVLYAGAFGHDPTDLAVRQKHGRLTNWFFTIGSKEGSDDTPSTRSYQVKHLLHDGRTLTPEQRDELQRLLRSKAQGDVVDLAQGIVLRSSAVLRKFIAPAYREALESANLNLADDQIDARVRNIASRIANHGELTSAAGDSDALIAFDRNFWSAANTGIANALTTTRFSEVRKVLTEADLDAIDAVILAQLSPDQELDKRGRELVAKMLMGPQFALAATLVDQQSAEGHKTFNLQAIYAKGLSRTVNLTLNAAYERPEGEVGDDDSLKIAAQVRKQLRSARAGKKPMFLDIVADSSLLDDDRTYRAQAKATLPIIRGLQVPISVTWANRDELVDESNVTGHIGISFDFANVADFFKRSTDEE